MSLLIAVADAVTAVLNAAELSMAFEAVRVYEPRTELEALDVVHVSVMPAAVRIASASRAADQHDYQVDVGVQMRPEALGENPDSADALMRLVEEIIDLFRGRRLATEPPVVWVGTQNEPVFSQEHLQTKHLLTSVISLTFRAWR
jgi:hypothetical protein